jgi:hypothetical protein
MSAGPKTDTQTPNKRPDRMMQWIMLITFAVGLLIPIFVLFLTIPGLPLYLGDKGRVSILADVLLICFALCPMILCLFPIYLLLMVSIYGLELVYRMTSKPLGRAREITQTVADKTAESADNISRKSIEISARFAFFDRLVNFFDRKTSQAKHKGKPDESDTKHK